MHGTQTVLPKLLCRTTSHPPPEMLDDDGKVDLILVTHDCRGRKAAASAMRNAVFQRRSSQLGAHPGDLKKPASGSTDSIHPGNGALAVYQKPFSISAGDSNQRIDPASPCVAYWR